MDAANELPHTRMVAGALAHLARSMRTGCPTAAHLAALLLARVSDDPGADACLRDHARELAEILDSDESCTETGGTPQSLPLA